MQVTKEHRGFTLVETVVALGVFAGAVGIATAVATDVMRGNRDLLARQGMTQLSQELASASSTNALCERYSLRFPSGSLLDMSVASTHTGQKILATYGGGTVGEDNALPNYGLSKTDLRISDLVSLGTTNANGEMLYQGLLRLSGEKAGSSLGSAVLPPRLLSPIIVSMAANQIRNCYGRPPNTGADCVINPATHQCEGSLPAQGCSAGQIATGYLNGTLQCRSVSSVCPNPNDLVVGLQDGNPICAPRPAVVPPTVIPVPGPGTGTGDAATYAELYKDPTCGGPVVHNGPLQCQDFNNPAAISARLGLPECGVPKVGVKCFIRVSAFLMGQGGPNGSTSWIGIMTGIPKF